MGANWSALTKVASNNPNAPQIRFEGEKVVLGPVGGIGKIRAGSVDKTVRQFEMLSKEEIRSINSNSLSKIRDLLLERFGNEAGNAVFHQVFQNKLASARSISSTEILLADKLGAILEGVLQRLSSSAKPGNVKTAKELLENAFAEPLLEGVSALSKQDAKALKVMVQERLKVIEPILKKGNLEDAQGQLEAQLSVLRASYGYHRTVSNAFYGAVTSRTSSQPPAAPYTLEFCQSLQTQSDWERLIQPNDPSLLQGKTVAQQDVEKVAKLCFEKASTHPQAVRAILHFNQNVREAALSYLCSDAPLDSKGEEEQRALALCYLEAGYPLDNILPNEQQYADSVLELMQDRHKAQELYWQDHQEKHIRREDENPQFLSDAFSDATRSTLERDDPFFYSDPKKYSNSLKDIHFGAKYRESPYSQEKFVTHFLYEAAAGNTELTTKEFLAAIAKRDLSQLNYQTLDKAAEWELNSGLTIHFSSKQFGALIRSMVLDMQEGESRSFRVGWRANPTGHAMRVFVEKTKPKEDSKEDGKTGEAIVGKTGAGGIETKEAPKDQGMPKEYEEISRIKVGLYDPDVAGNNISHLKLLPEELAGLNFDEFVKRHRGEVLALHVNDPQLVDYYAGKFVNADRSSQIASLGQAMANNNLVETKRIIERLTGSTGAHDPKGSAIAPSKQPLTKQEANCLIDGLYYALQDGRTKPLKAFLENFTKLADALGLTATQVVSLLEARDERGVPGLHMALNAGQPDAVKEFLEALPSLAKTFELTPNQITSLLEAKDAKGFPGLHMALRHGESDAAIAYLEALLKLKERNLLTDKQITSLLEAKFDGRTILQMADRNGKVKTADDFLASLLNHGFEPTWVNSLRHPTQGKFWRR